MSRLTGVNGVPSAQGLYDPAQEHDACGIGFVASVRGEKSHAIVRDGIQVLLNLAHRAHADRIGNVDFVAPHIAKAPNHIDDCINTHFTLVRAPEGA